MTREELRKVSEDNFSEIVRKISVHRKIKYGNKEYTVEDCIKQYDPLKHDVFDKSKRPDKLLSEQGDVIYDAVNSVERNTTEYSSVPVNRLPLPIQKRIVLISSTFLIGERIGIESEANSVTDKDLETKVRKLWRDNKLDYLSKEIAKIMMSETHCAELWYDYEDERYWRGTNIEKSKKRFGVKILAESKGDKLYPVFDEYDDLIAFGREYSLVNESKSVLHFDLYTADKIIKGVKEGGEWTVEEVKNPYGAIPVIYYSQEAPEWADVQPLIERKEARFSDFADTNDYFADPALVSNGAVENLPSKGEVGKTFQITGDGDVRYLTWDSAPEAMKLEFEMLNQEINAGTHTPNISFDSMKTLIGNTSGIALKLLFMDAQIKASDKQEAFGLLIQRRLNLLKKLIAHLSPADYENNTLELRPVFTPYMPINDVEYNQMLIDAYNAKMISHKTMVSKSTLVSDAEQEIKDIGSLEEKKEK